MDPRENITHIIIKNIAEIFGLEPEYVAAHPELRFREDLHAKSLQYFPLIGVLEIELDIELDYHEFQYEARTIQHTIDFVNKIYEENHHDNN